jgi:hypothetical protein
MASLSAAQIQSYAAGAGFTGPDLTTAVAIALAESSGNPSIIGDNGQSYGLWQINIPSHPNLNGPSLLNPAANAQAAYSIYAAAGGSFTPWTTFNTGAYLAYMPGGQPASSPATTPADDSSVIDVGNTDADSTDADSVDDDSDTADLTSVPAQASIFGNIDSNTLLILTAAAVGVFFLSGFLSDED